MAQQGATRKLAAILAADVVGYSRLMEADEDATIRTLDTYRQVIDRMVENHRGRVFGSAGDSVIAEFASPVEAVGCAADIQRELEQRNADLPEDRRMQLRIGVNLGDVVVKGDNLLGDGVNIAARLETLADAGGICLSQSVLDQVKKHLDLGYEYLGEQEVKNIAEPVRAYRVLTAPEAAGQVIGEARRAMPASNRVALAAAVIVLMGVAGAVAWLRPWVPAVEPASVERMALPLPDKPSIAVLPFANMSGDADQDYFADGMTDDLITDLSQISGLFVIARNSVFTYKGTPVKVQQVSRELGVRYVLEGSVRRVGDKVRINAQLIDATTGHHLWAERYDRDYSDLFALQDEVIGRIVAALAVELTDAEETHLARKPTENLEAYDFYLRAELGRHGYGFGRRLYALGLYRRAIELDPDFADAYAGVATLAADIWRFNIEEVLPGPVARQSAYEWASHALALDPESPQAHAVLGLLEMVEGRHDDAIDAVRKAVSLDPNSPQAYVYLAIVLTYAGRHAEALVAIETALRLDPKPPAYFYADLGWVLFFNRRYEAAIGALETARDAGVGELEMLPMVYAQLGRIDEAKAAAEKLRAIDGRFSNLAYYRILYAHHKRAEDLEHRLAALRKAGVPEWPNGIDGRAEDRLDAAAVEALVFGRTWIGETGVEPFVKSIGEDGRFAMRNRSVILVGAASVEGDMYCEAYEALLMGRKSCGYIYRNPGGTPDEGTEFVYINVFSPSRFSLAQ